MMDWMALMTIALIIVSALILMVLEAFLPTAGLLGVAGAGLIALGAWLCHQHFGMTSAIALAVLSAVASIAIVRGIFHSLKHGRMAQSGLFMREETHAALHTPTSTLHVGMTGRSLSALHPAGIAQFGGERVHVVAEGAFIAANVPIRVTRVEGMRVLVVPVQ